MSAREIARFESRGHVVHIERDDDRWRVVSRHPGGGVTTSSFDGPRRAEDTFVCWVREILADTKP